MEKYLVLAQIDTMLPRLQQISLGEQCIMQSMSCCWLEETDGQIESRENIIYISAHE